MDSPSRREGGSPPNPSPNGTSAESRAPGASGENEGVGSQHYEVKFRVERRLLEYILQAPQFVKDGQHLFDRLARQHGISAITVDPNFKIGARSKKDPTVRVQGESQQKEEVDAAAAELADYFDSKTNRVVMRVDIPAEKHYFVIGKKGCNVREAMNSSGCHIHFPETSRDTSSASPSKNQVTITGLPEGVEHARVKLRGLTPVIICIDVPAFVPRDELRMTPLIQSTAERFGITIFFKQHSGRVSVMFKGPRARASVLEEAARHVLSKWNMDTALRSYTLQFDVSCVHHMALLNHRGGSSMAHLMHRTNTTISFLDPGRGSAVQVTGPRDKTKTVLCQLQSQLPISISFDLMEEATQHLLELAERNHQSSLEQLLSSVVAPFPSVSVNFKLGAHRLNVTLKGIEAAVSHLYQARRAILMRSQTKQVQNFGYGGLDIDSERMNTICDDSTFFTPFHASRFADIFGDASVRDTRSPAPFDHHQQQQHQQQQYQPLDAADQYGGATVPYAGDMQYHHQQGSHHMPQQPLHTQGYGGLGPPPPQVYAGQPTSPQPFHPFDATAGLTGVHDAYVAPFHQQPQSPGMYDQLSAATAQLQIAPHSAQPEAALWQHQQSHGDALYVQDAWQPQHHQQQAASSATMTQPSTSATATSAAPPANSSPPQLVAQDETSSGASSMQGTPDRSRGPGPTPSRAQTLRARIKDVDYEKRRQIAEQAVADETPRDVRVPTDLFVGDGFSRSMPAHEIKKLWQRSGGAFGAVDASHVDGDANADGDAGTASSRPYGRPNDNQGGHAPPRLHASAHLPVGSLKGFAKLESLPPLFEPLTSPSPAATTSNQPTQAGNDGTSTSVQPPAQAATTPTLAGFTTTTPSSSSASLQQQEEEPQPATTAPAIAATAATADSGSSSSASPPHTPQRKAMTHGDGPATPSRSAVHLLQTPAEPGSEEMKKYWNVRSLPELLAKLGLHSYDSLFSKEEIDLALFLTLSEEDLINIGVSTFGARRKMLLAISNLKSMNSQDQSFLGNVYSLSTSLSVSPSSSLNLSPRRP